MTLVKVTSTIAFNLILKRNFYAGKLAYKTNTVTEKDQTKSKKMSANNSKQNSQKNRKFGHKPMNISFYVFIQQTFEKM